MKKKTLRDKLDDMTREICFLKAPDMCELCKKDKPLTHHHVYGRGGSVRYDKDCQSGICIDCHQWCTDNSVKAREKYRQIRGSVWYDRTVVLYRQTRSWKQWEMEELEVELTTELQQLRNELR